MQHELQNVRAISKIRRALEAIRVPVDPNQPNGKQRRLTEHEIDFLIIKVTCLQNIHIENTPMLGSHYIRSRRYWSSPGSLIQERFRKGINLNQRRWPDAEVRSKPQKTQDLHGNKYYVFLLAFAKGKAGAE